MPYDIFADLILIIHLLYVAFAIGGELIILIGAIFKWHFIYILSFRIIHLISVIFVAIEASLGIICPLTSLEYNFRILSGQNVESNMTLIARLVRKVIFYDFPSFVFTITYILFGLVVICTIIFIPPKKNVRR
ncbi:MAG: DUF2784 domain-containing protein [Spirochaetaceae bacterium]